MSKTIVGHGTISVAARAQAYRDGRRRRRTPMTLVVSTRPDVDWVAERARCERRAVFTRLKDGIRHDVKTRNDLRADDSQYKFEVLEDGPDHLSVIVHHVKAQTVSVAMVNGEIHIAYDHTDTVATPVLADDGECRIQFGSLVLTEWQVRRRMLETLFFVDVPV
jgi:hypothetical protein